MLSAFHPTKRLLVETVVNFLNSKSPSEILAEEVLEISGVSKGSMYHHFEDLQDLVETAQIYRYSKWIDASIEFLTKNVATARSKDELREALRVLTVVTQTDERKAARAERALALAACFDNPRMAKQMGFESQRMTDAITDVVEDLKNKEFINSDVNAKAAATWIQAYTLGKLVNDYNSTGVTEDEWVDFIMSIVDSRFMAK
ncbi:MAG: TetR/AcrR family transcriptional regulator [Actinobacteria bacterium]|jgi:AcrR family transcriptional regulator|nr:TetR/AcrR family transcriptional regulator [Actinomycetota bacterium]